MDEAAIEAKAEQLAVEIGDRNMPNTARAGIKAALTAAHDAGWDDHRKACGSVLIHGLGSTDTDGWAVYNKVVEEIRCLRKGKP